MDTFAEGEKSSKIVEATEIDRGCIEGCEVNNVDVGIDRTDVESFTVSDQILSLLLISFTCLRDVQINFEGWKVK